MSAPFQTLYGDVVEIGGLTFDSGIHDDAKWIADEITGWNDTPELTYVATNYPNRDGAAWAENGSFYRARGLVLMGALAADTRGDFERARESLKAALAVKSELTIVRRESVPKQMKVRLAGQITWPEVTDTEGRFLVPLLAPDPFKASLLATDLTLSVKSPVIWRRHLPRHAPRHYVATSYQTSVVTDTNWVPDPNAEGTTTWGPVSGGAAGTNITSPQDRLRSLVVNWNVNTTSIAQSGVFPTNGLREADPFSFSYDIRNGPTGAIVTGQVQGQILFYDANGTLLATFTAPFTTTTSTPARQKVTGVAPAGVTQAKVVFSAKGLDTINAGNISIDRIMLNRDSTAAYFDGVSGGCQWTGVTDNSASQKLSLVTVTTTQESVVFTNIGTHEEYPVSTVTGPLPLGWRMRNATTGEELGFSYALRSGQVMTIDHRKQTAVVDNGDHAEALYFGTWWALQPGDNRLELYSPTYDNAARWSLSPRSRWV